MKIYNTLTRQIETFTPLDPKRVKIYTCGPTVYNFQHIGNYTAYVYWDLLLRVIQANGWTPYRVLNLTDVGHLSSDGDEGEDKLEKGARRENKTVWEVAEFYAQDFLENFRALKLLEPAKIARATDYIGADLELVNKLLEKGYAYEITDGIYYDTAKFSDYANLGRLNLEQLKAGARVDFNPEKRHASDFALWKFIQPGEKHAMRWQFRDRDGYPGWHIECAAIIHAELGEPIDIHTGGMDHIPVHHTNEIAQSEAAYGKKMANFWVHCNFITVENQKMSKSLGNVYTLDDLRAKGFSPLDFKMWVLEGHFQTQRNFTFAELVAAKNRRLNWRNRIARLYQLKPKQKNPTSISTKILAALNNNLNSPQALALIDATNDLSLADWQKIDQWLGLELINSAPDYSSNLAKTLAKRQTARACNDFATADKIRTQLSEQNIAILDTPDGAIWQYLA